MFKDSTLQIFLTIYHGSLIGTFFYDYIIRNLVRLVDDGNPKWDYLTNIGLGVLFIVVIVWLILSVWSKIRRNLLISWIILIIIFIVRASVGITNLMDRYRKNKEEIAIFTTQMTVHLFGILATMILSRVA